MRTNPATHRRATRPVTRKWKRAGSSEARGRPKPVEDLHYGYELWLPEPTVILYAAIANMGDAVQAKDGVFVVRLQDDTGEELNHEEYELPISPRLGKPYQYVPAAPAGGLMRLNPIASKRPFQGVSMQYVGIFTDHPLSVDQLGPVFYSMPENNGERSLCSVTRVARLTPISARGV